MSTDVIYPRITTDVTLNFYIQVTQEKTDKKPMKGYLQPHPSIAQANTYPPLNAVRSPLPFDLPIGKINFWNGVDWEIHDDHRQVMDDRGRIIEGSGTPYWSNGDTWETPGKYLDVPGPFPKGVLLDQPKKPDPTFTEVQNELLSKLNTDVKLTESSGYVISSLGFEIDATERSYTDTQGLITKMIEKDIPTELFCDCHNNFHEVTLKDVQTIHLEIIEYGQEIYARKWSLRNQILMIVEDEDEKWRDQFAVINWDKDLNMITEVGSE